MERCRLYALLQTSAAALAVGVGTFCDPETIQGLAHFCEHSTFVRLFGRLFVCLFDSFFVRLFDRLFVRLFDRLFVCLFDRLFVCLFDRLFVCLFLTAQRHTKTIKVSNKVAYD